MQFSFLDKKTCKETLPILFSILYENMSRIAPTGRSYDEERADWLSEVLPAMQKEPRRILLLRDGDALAGYLQYYVHDGVFMVEELQLKESYQRTRALYRLCCFLKSMLPKDIRWIEAYAHKANVHSQSVIQALGMERIEETGELWHYRGDFQPVFRRFK